jgi:pimeloyl-ACP methyl ester carboxylesterase
MMLRPIAWSVLALLIGLGGARYATVTYERACAAAYPPVVFVEIDGGRIHYATAGQGRPVVLLHGDGGSLLDFTMSPIFDQLAQRHQVVALDRPGHGLSDASDDAENLLGQAELVREAIRRLDLADPVLVGHSRGGSVVAAYVDRYPDEVGAAVSLGGAMLADGDPPTYAAYRPAVWPIVGPLLARTVYAPVTRFNDHALLRDGLDRAFAPEGPAPDEYVEAYACRWVSPSTIRTTYRLAQDTHRELPRIRSRYPELRVPVIIVHGDADGNVDPASAVAVHREIPGSDLRLLPGGGHEPQFTRPDEVIRAVEDAAALAEG